MVRKYRQRSPWPLVLIGTGVLMLLGAVGWQFFFPAPALPPTESPITPNQPNSEVQRISVEDAKAAYDAGQAVFLDIRDSESYARGHIPGAVLLPLSEVPERLSEFDPEAWIITYCT